MSAEARPPAAGPPFLAVCGSRKPAPGISRPSAARELLRAVVQGMAEAGAEAAWLDLRDLDLPHFDGRPPEADGSADLERARAQVLRSQVVVLSVPAFWQGPAGVVKNFLDLVGGPAYDAPPDQAPPLAGKVVALLVVGADRGSGHSALGAMRLTSPRWVPGPRRERRSSATSGRSAVPPCCWPPSRSSAATSPGSARSRHPSRRSGLRSHRFPGRAWGRAGEHAEHPDPAAGPAAGRRRR